MESGDKTELAVSKITEEINIPRFEINNYGNFGDDSKITENKKRSPKSPFRN
jgi:hypothetical protein